MDWFDVFNTDFSTPCASFLLDGNNIVGMVAVKKADGNANVECWKLQKGALVRDQSVTGMDVGKKAVEATAGQIAPPAGQIGMF